MSAAVVITGGRVLREDGSFTGPGDLHIAGGVFTGPVAGPPAGPAETPGAVGDPEVLDAGGLWVIPGVYDAHTHITWNEFHRDARDAQPAEERDRLTAEGLARTLRGGITSLRDGGGATAALRDDLAAGRLAGPRLQITVDMIGPAQAGSVDRVRTAVAEALDKGAQWIKLVATAGSSTPGDQVLVSNFSREEILAAGRVAAEGGARLMVHSWGGDSTDWAIEAGAGSIEHGIYLTDEQAARAAQAGVTFVPTLTIYRHVREMVQRGELTGVPLPRITDVIAVHETAVLRARDAGLPIAVGNDFTVPWQHGTNLVEIGSLIRAGLTPGEALTAATRTGARLLSDGGTGVIEPGARADAVVLRRDPQDPTTYDDPANVVAVVQGGAVVHRAL